MALSKLPRYLSTMTLLTAVGIAIGGGNFASADEKAPDGASEAGQADTPAEKPEAKPARKGKKSAAKPATAEGEKPATTEGDDGNPPAEEGVKGEKSQKAKPGDDTAAKTDATKGEKGGKPATRPVVKVQRGNLKLQVRSEAVLQPIDPYELRTKFKVYSGPLVIQSIAEPGALVRKGQPVLAFERTWMDWTLSAAEGESAVAKAAYAKVQADVKLSEQAEKLSLRQAEDNVNEAEASKKWFEEVDGPQMLTMSDLSVKRAQDSVDDQSDELDQLKKMYEGEELTTATADIVVRRSIRALEQSKVLLKMQQQRRDKTKQVDYPQTRQRVLDAVEQTRRSLASVQNQQAQAAVARQAQLVASRVAMEQAERKLADLKDDSEQMQFKSPTDGVVAYGSQEDGVLSGGDPKQYRVGEKLPAGQVLLRVYEPNKLRLVVSVPESQLFWVSQADVAHVTPASMPQKTLPAKASTVEQQSKKQGLAFVCNVDLEESDSALMAGMRATVVIDADDLKDVLLIPMSAVQNSKVMKVREGEDPESVEVKLGKTDGQQVEVLKGLQQGDEILAKP